MIENRWSITVQDGKITYFHTCAVRDCNGSPDGMITKYYSNKHAEDEGWRTTSIPEYAKPYETAWICPNCVKDIKAKAAL